MNMHGTRIPASTRSMFAFWRMLRRPRPTCASTRARPTSGDCECRRPGLGQRRNSAWVAILDYRHQFRRKPGCFSSIAVFQMRFKQPEPVVLDTLRRELQAARYRAQRAERQYEATDRENRLVAQELERRWNVALQEMHA